VGESDIEIEVLCILVFWIFTWVRRSTLQLGVQGRERKRKREKDMKLSAQIELYVFI
jgi:hypothetical protein